MIILGRRESSVQLRLTFESLVQCSCLKVAKYSEEEYAREWCLITSETGDTQSHSKVNGTKLVRGKRLSYI